MKTKILIIALLILGTHFAHAYEGEVQATLQFRFDISELHGNINEVNSMSAAAARDLTLLTQGPSGQPGLCRSEWIGKKTLWTINSHYTEFKILCDNEYALNSLLKSIAAIQSSGSGIFELPQYQYTVQKLSESFSRQ